MIRDDAADLRLQERGGQVPRRHPGNRREDAKQGRPVLVGTTSVETSERLSNMLKRARHRARGPERQASRARGRRSSPMPASPGAVTIATNMAGRGTDIVLGPGVAEAGGLHIIGTERHESRRIDNQLRGRSGRQGDPGSSRFYVSLEDELMRRFGARADRRPDGAARHGRGRADRAPRDLASRSRAPRPRSKATTSISAATSSSTTTS